MLFAAIILVTSLCHYCNASSYFSPLRPPAIPLAVRSPYMNTWQQAGSDGGNGGYLPGQWPTFWKGADTGWQGLIRVDNKTYTWMGQNKEDHVTQTAFQYTSTRSIFTLSIEGFVEMTVTFLSPVTPDDLTRSSLPYSYMDVEIRSTDGTSHDIQLYTDVTAEWVSGDRNATAQWSYGVVTEQAQPNQFGPVPTPSFPATVVPTTYATKTSYSVQPIVTRSAAADYIRPFDERITEDSAPVGAVAYHKIWRKEQMEFAEVNNQAEWGNWYYATANTNDLTHQSGSYTIVRDRFIKHGKLDNTEDTQYRAINDDFPVFGFAFDLGAVSGSPTTTVFQLSLHQQNCVRFQGASGDESVPCLWTSYFPNDTSALNYYYNDYSTASNMATSFDSQVSKDSLAAGGQDYLSLTSLAVRQAFGALEYTNSPEKPWVFLKEISSDGNIQTVDVLFPFHPIAIYANATILRYMLDPLFINQEAGHWPYAFSIHDLGDSFPNATGHSDGDDEKMPVEECGNMMIMTLAYAQRTGDDAYLAQHYEILKQWNDYLVSDSLIPQDQLSTDDFAGALANQTNLAIKGIIGIEAMAQIANRTGHQEDSRNYTKISHRYVEEWMGYAIAGASESFAKPHTTLDYGHNNTFSLLYNLYGDKELGLDLVPQAVYEMQSEFYPTVLNEYGVPLDTRHTYTKADWQMLCASVASEATKDEFTSTAAKWLDDTPTNFAFSDLYDTDTGNYPSLTFRARPVVGAMFAFLALNSAP